MEPEIRTLFLRRAGIGHQVAAHAHQAVYQWYCCYRGGLAIDLDGRRFRLRGGDSILVQPGVVRACRCDGRVPEYLFAIFTPGELELDPVCHRVLDLGEHLRPDLEALVCELRGVGAIDSPLLRRILFLRLLLGLCRQVRIVAVVPQREAELVRLVEQVMRANLHRELSREDLARAVHMSAPHLARCFKAACGCSLHRRLTELRMDQARLLLRESTMNVSRIAGEVGFISFSHFSKTFKAATGQTPSVYRRGQ